LNNKTRKETQIKFHKAVAVPTLTYGSEIWAIKKNKQEAKIETALLRSIAGYTNKGRIRNNKI
jgi:hypothetical protein